MQSGSEAAQSGLPQNPLLAFLNSYSPPAQVYATEPLPQPPSSALSISRDAITLTPSEVVAKQVVSTTTSINAPIVDTRAIAFARMNKYLVTNEQHSVAMANDLNAWLSVFENWIAYESAIEQTAAAYYLDAFTQELLRNRHLLSLVPVTYLLIDILYDLNNPSQTVTAKESLTSAVIRAKSVINEHFADYKKAIPVEMNMLAFYALAQTYRETEMYAICNAIYIDLGRKIDAQLELGKGYYYISHEKIKKMLWNELVRHNAPREKILEAVERLNTLLREFESIFRQRQKTYEQWQPDQPAHPSSPFNRGSSDKNPVIEAIVRCLDRHSRARLSMTSRRMRREVMLCVTSNPLKAINFTEFYVDEYERYQHFLGFVKWVQPIPGSDYVIYGKSCDENDGEGVVPQVCRVSRQQPYAGIFPDIMIMMNHCFDLGKNDEKIFVDPSIGCAYFSNSKSVWLIARADFPGGGSGPLLYHTFDIVENAPAAPQLRGNKLSLQHMEVYAYQQPLTADKLFLLLKDKHDKHCKTHVIKYSQKQRALIISDTITHKSLDTHRYSIRLTCDDTGEKLIFCERHKNDLEISVYHQDDRKGYLLSHSDPIMIPMDNDEKSDKIHECKYLSSSQHLVIAMNYAVLILKVSFNDNTAPSITKTAHLRRSSPSLRDDLYRKYLFQLQQGTISISDDRRENPSDEFSTNLVETIDLNSGAVTTTVRGREHLWDSDGAVYYAAKDQYNETDVTVKAVANEPLTLYNKALHEVFPDQSHEKSPESRYAKMRNLFLFGSKNGGVKSTSLAPKLTTRRKISIT